MPSLKNISASTSNANIEDWSALIAPEKIIPATFMMWGPLKLLFKHSSKKLNTLSLSSKKKNRSLMSRKSSDQNYTNWTKPWMKFWSRLLKFWIRKSKSSKKESWKSKKNILKLKINTRKISKQGTIACNTCRLTKIHPMCWKRNFYVLVNGVLCL